MILLTQQVTAWVCQASALLAAVADTRISVHTGVCFTGSDLEQLWLSDIAGVGGGVVSGGEGDPQRGARLLHFHTKPSMPLCGNTLPGTEAILFHYSCPSLDFKPELGTALVTLHPGFQYPKVGIH